MKSEPPSIDCEVLIQTVEFPELGNALLSAERMLEECRYAEVVDLLRPLSQDDQWRGNQVFFLVFYYMGQALFRQEMARKSPHEKWLNKASSLLRQSLSYRPDFIDPHLLLGLLCIAKANISSSVLNISVAKDHFKEAVHLGNASQKKFAQRKLEFLIKQQRSTNTLTQK